MSDDTAKGHDTSALLKIIDAITIAPADARTMAERYTMKARAKHPALDSAAIRGKAADALIAHYARMSATSGGATALAGVVPGIGTVIATVGGATADLALTVKWQLDMSMCVAYAMYETPPPDEQLRHLVYLIALGGSLEHAGSPVATQLASKAGVRLVRQYLKGAVLQTIKELLKKLGIIFTRKALERAIPFGIGVVISSAANYALARYVGRQAKRWFEIDATLPSEPA